jgi:hypothetical protein
MVDHLLFVGLLIGLLLFVIAILLVLVAAILD